MSDELILDEEDVLADKAWRQQVLDRDTAAARVLENRKRAYVRVFAGDARKEDLELVLSDLLLFCRADRSTFDADARVQAMLEGRREVWLRIQDFRRLELSALAEKYK